MTTEADRDGDKTARELARWAREGKAGTPPVPAATVILVRDGVDAAIETLMLRRNSKIAFGGMWVFPGGRVDEGDREADEDHIDLAPARRAAVREAEEEAGLELEGHALVPYSHWTPPPVTPRRFLTWFFLAAAPETEIRVDGGEIREHVWLRPAEALERRDAGEIELAPPTWVTLHELTRHPNVAEALAAAREQEPQRFETHIGVGEHGPIAMWHGDAGWPGNDPTADGARHRLSMFGGSWVYERS